MSAVEVDLLIVGAGLAGLFGAYYGRHVSVPDKQIFAVAGFRAVTGRQLIINLLEQATLYNPIQPLGHESRSSCLLPAVASSVPSSRPRGSRCSGTVGAPCARTFDESTRWLASAGAAGTHCRAGAIFIVQPECG